MSFNAIPDCVDGIGSCARNFFAMGKINFTNYKIATASTSWVLAGVVGFIIGKYFGESDKNCLGESQNMIHMCQ
jgi:hypothetical protein